MGPESPDHRQTIDAIGLAAAAQLAGRFQVFRDMNWYPPDGGNAMAPDVMVLPAGAFVPPADFDPSDRLKSYRQDKTGGPGPVVVVEVPSESESYSHVRGKTDRYCDLGCVVYVVLIDPPYLVERFSPDNRLGQDWDGSPIPGLGGIRITFNEGDPTVVTPDDLSVRSDVDLLRQRTDRTTLAERRAVAAEQRAAALAQRLRDLGVDPAS